MMILSKMVAMTAIVIVTTGRPKKGLLAKCWSKINWRAKSSSKI